MHKEHRQPYNAPTLDALLILDLSIQGCIAAPDDPHALKNVAIVGGVIFDDGKGTLNPEDYDLVLSAAAELKDAGIKISPNTKFYIYNLFEPVGVDFLESGIQLPGDTIYPDTDLLLSAYICNTPAGNHWGFDNLRPELKVSFKNAWDLRQRHYADHNPPARSSWRQGNDPDIWANSARATNAKVIITKGSDDEIGTPEMSKAKHYHVLISTFEKYESDPSCHKLGFLIDPDYAEAIGDTVNAQHKIGSAIQDTAKQIEAGTFKVEPELTRYEKHAEESSVRLKEFRDKIHKQLGLDL